MIIIELDLKNRGTLVAKNDFLRKVATFQVPCSAICRLGKQQLKEELSSDDRAVLLTFI